MMPGMVSIVTCQGDCSLSENIQYAYLISLNSLNLIFLGLLACHFNIDDYKLCCETC